MKYYHICQKILGYKIFSQLIEYLLKGISDKFGTEITVDEFGKIIEINIDALMMLAIASKYPSKKEFVMKQLEISISYLVTDTIEQFAIKNDYYITLIKEKI